MMYLRYIFVGLIHVPMYIAGVVFFPIYYLFRKPIAKYQVPVWWWFLNADEVDYISNTYGDANYRKRRGFDYYNTNVFRKVWEAFIWLAIRNSHWNFRSVTGPNNGTPHRINIIHNDTDPPTSGMTFCNYDIKGKQFATYYVGKRKYFRYSFNKPTPKWMFMFRDRWVVQLGWAPGRAVFKSRWYNDNARRV